MSSNHSSTQRREDYESSSEMDGMSHTSGLPGRSTGGSPIPPPTPGGSSSTTNLSGLVCNVHRTTGREPHPLVGATTTILGDKLYVFGGRKISKSRPTLTSDLYELDLPRRHWSKIETKGDVPPPRYFHSVCSLGDNKLVCYGGMSPEGGPAAQNESPDAQVSVMSDVHIYDIPSHTWTKISNEDFPQGRYAHCAAIVPSGAVFASSNAPLSAIHHNPPGPLPNMGSIGVELDGRGGAEMIVVGGQDSNNQYIEQISVFNLRSLRWSSTNPMSGRSCGAYRSVVTPLVSMEAAKVGAGHEAASIDGYDDDDEDDESELGSSGSAMLIYTNYNFLDVKLELQVRRRDGVLVDKQMQGTVTPPGLRFPTGGVIGNNFVVAGTFLTSSKQEFSLWALDLRSLTWARIDSGSSIFSQGSWNRGVLWERRNSFIILGNRRRNLVDDYNNRRLNFNNMCVVQLEAFGLYDNPRKACPTSDYVSVSAPQYQPGSEGSAGGRRLYSGAEELGEIMLRSRELCDMDFLAIDGTRLPVNSRLIGRRWGAFFNQLMREGAGPVESGENSALRPATLMSRDSSMTITPTLTNSSTLTANSVTGTTMTLEAADVRSMPPNLRPRTLYLPHTVPALQALVYYLYTGSLPEQPSHLATPQIFCSLLQIARPYEIDGLSEEVTERLHEMLDGRNAAAIFNAAAMAAGGGKGVAFKDVGSNVHPPRVQSLAGVETLSINEINGGNHNPLRVDTERANGRSTRTTLRGESLSEEDEDVPDSASTTGSGYSSTTSSRLGGRDDEEVWDGGQSHVIGLQKRGLRGLMEGRRIRERGRSDGVSDGTASSIAGGGSVAGGSVASGSVAGGSVSGPSEPQSLGLGIF
jgi:hypothetical protein